MDTVWIKLTTVVKVENQLAKEQEEHFMFGPTGIVRFKTESDITLLLNSSKAIVAKVTENSEYIMDILRKIRGTEGKLNAKQIKKTKNKSRISKK